MQKKRQSKKRLITAGLIVVFAIALIAAALLFLTRPERTGKVNVETKAGKSTVVISPPEIVKPTEIAKQGNAHVNLPKLAIVIDDVGYDNKILKSFISLDLPLTYAVLPNATRYRQSVNILEKANLDYLIHMPMQPDDYPGINPGKNALLINMSNNKIKQLTEEAIKKLPDAIGVNNHMGSAFVQNKKKMEAFLSVLKEHNLFFLDSETTSKTIGWRLAETDGIRFARRNIFLDNIKNIKYIEKQLFKAADYAKLHKVAIAIGHDRPLTELALAQTKDALSKIVDFVEVKTVIDNQIK